MISSISLVGKKKTGKTTLALTFPKPLVVFDFEMGVGRVEPRFMPKTGVTVHQMTPANPVLLKTKPELAMSFWLNLLEEYNKALEDPKVKTIVFDTFTAVWEARRLGFLAELNEIAKKNGESQRKNLMPQEYFIPNSDMKQLLVQAQIHQKHLVVTHHTRPVYDTSGRDSGLEEPDGFKYTGDLVDVELWMSKVKGVPTGTIKTCGLSISAEGLNVESPDYDKLDKLIEGFRNIGT